MQKANPTVIGGFVLGAVVLGIGGIIILGGGRSFVETTDCVMYFDGSVKGLQSGADVLFRGVPVGQVDRIVGRIDVDPETGEVHIPVYVSMIEEAFLRREGDRVPDRAPRVILKHLIEDKGLRAKLMVDSLLTGRLFVALDFEPETPIRYRGGDKEDVPEIPTIVSARTGI